MTSVEKTVSWLSTLPQLLLARRKWITALVVAYVLYRKLKKLARSRHSAFYKGLDPLRPDPALFPQYFLCRGLWLHHRAWTVTNGSRPRALVFLSHGFAEHIGRYEHVARALVAHCGVNVYALDHQGHGRSDGDRAYVERFAHYADDFISFVRFIEKQWVSGGGAPVPVFLLGHSMGGAIAIQVARRTPYLVRASGADGKELASGGYEIVKPSANAKGSPTLTATAPVSGSAAAAPTAPPADNSDLWPWSGVILSAPLLEPDKTVATPFMKFVARLASAYLPKLSPRKLDARAVSRYQSVVENYRTDPLVYNGNIRARWGWEVMRVTQDIATAAPTTFRFPMLIVQGSADRLVDPEGAKRFHDRAASGDKTLKVYAGHYHEVFNDLDHEKVMADVSQWINARVP